jgi:hypothetical protein
MEKVAEQIETVAVEELRRKYDELCRDYDQLRIRVLAFITGELALVTFLFSKGIHLPTVIYGIVFLAIGTVCIIASFVILLFSLRGIEWHRPISRHYIQDIDREAFPDKETFLAYIKEAYTHVLDSNIPRVGKISRLFDISLMLLIAGVIIVMIIKYGQGNIIWHNIVRN